MNPEILNSAVVVDVETSGPSFEDNDILAVALCPLMGHLPPLNVYVRPPEIRWTDVGRAYFENYKDQWKLFAVDPATACDRITEYIQTVIGARATVIAHNVAFDFAFFRKMFHRARKNELEWFTHRAIDTHTMLVILHLQGRIPSSALSSSGALEWFSIDVQESLRHTAMGDAYATRVLFREILRALNIGAE